MPVASSKKVLLVSGIFPPQIGGPATFIPRLAENLVLNYGCRVTVICSSDSRTDVSDSSRPYTVRRVPIARPAMYRIELYRQLALGILTHNVIFVNGLDAFVFPIARMLRRSYLIKVVGDSAWQQARNTGRSRLDIDRFQIDEEEQRRFADAIARRNSPVLYAARVVTPSKYLRRMVIGWGVPDDRVVMIPNGVDPDRFTVYSASERQSGPLQVLFVGRLTNWKGVETLLLAAQKVNNIRLCIAGDGLEYPHLAELAEQLGIAARVEFTGRISQPDVAARMARSHVLVLGSLYEGMSHTLLEAMASGLLCIAANRGGNDEVITSGRDGILIEPQNVDSLAAQLRSIEKNEDVRQKIAGFAREKSLSFSMDQTILAFSKLLLEPVKVAS